MTTVTSAEMQRCNRAREETTTELRAQRRQLKVRPDKAGVKFAAVASLSPRVEVTMDADVHLGLLVRLQPAQGRAEGA